MKTAILLALLVGLLMGGCAWAQPLFAVQDLPGARSPAQVQALVRPALAAPLRYRLVYAPGSGCSGLRPVAEPMFRGLLHAEVWVPTTACSRPMPTGCRKPGRCSSSGAGRAAEGFAGRWTAQAAKSGFPAKQTPMFTDLIPDADTAAKPEASARFLRLLETALAEGRFVKLLLSKPCGEDKTLERLMVREVMLRGEPQLSLLWRHQTKDITKNHALKEGVGLIAAQLGAQFQNAHLHTQGEEVQLAFSRKGRSSLRVSKVAASEQVPTGHDKEKQRYLELDKPFWTDLGVTHEVRGESALVPAMSRKWKQINRFIEIFGAALKSSGLADSPDVHVADFGSGKGYLTFAMYDWLASQGKDAQVTGVELRDDMVRLCGTAALKHGMAGLRFDQGDVRHYTPARLDVMVALHACDIATDYAIHLGLRAKSAVIMCSPCCHKQIRPQMKMPPVLRPLLQHGIHLGQEAEMVTDSLRALLLEAEGYETQVFEFIALEHTSKNKMILAVKLSGEAAETAAARRPEVLKQIAEIKKFYGLREQALESLLMP